MKGTKPTASPLILRTALAPARSPRLQMQRGDRAMDMAPPDREQMLADVVAGLDRRLQLDILAFQQLADAPNRNYVRFTPAAIRAMAGTFVGKPFLKDHEQCELEARGGVILSSTYDGAAGEGEIRQTVELSAPWAVEGMLRGLIDRFSIAWRPNTPMQPYCSVCEAPLFSLDCCHFPGDIVTTKSGDKVVEALYDDVTGTEVSAVNVPAVDVTAVEGVRMALAEYRAARPVTVQVPKETTMPNFMKLATLLALAADASEDAYVGAVEKLSAAKQAAESLHAAERAAHEVTRTELAGYKAEREKLEAAKREAEIAALCDKAAAKVGKGAVEAAVRSLAAVGIEQARKFVDELAQVLPIGKPPISLGTAPAVAGDRKFIDENQRKVNRQLGISDEDFLKYNPPERA